MSAEHDEATGGRGWPSPYLRVPLWLVFTAPPMARAMYEAIAAHVNDERGDSKAWPGRDVLADLMDLTPKSVDKYIRELEKLGAIDVIRRTDARGMKTTNVYVVHHDPPIEYTGPRTIAEYHERRRAAAERPVPAGRPVVPSTGLRTNQGKRTDGFTQNWDKQGKNQVPAGRPVVPSASLRSPVHGRPVVPSTGHELEEVELEETTPPTPRESEPAGATVTQDGGRDLPDQKDETELLVDEVKAARPAWSRGAIRTALQHPDVLDRPRHLWRPAFLAIAADPNTQYPSRLAQDGPWWSAAVPKQTRRTTDLDSADVVELAARREEAQRTVDASSHAAAVRAQLKSAKQ
jgi:hypothetical protein